MARSKFSGVLKYLLCLIPLSIYYVVRAFFWFFGPEGSGQVLSDARALDLARLFLIFWVPTVILTGLIMVVMIFSDITGYFQRRNEQKELKKISGR